MGKLRENTSGFFCLFFYYYPSWQQSREGDSKQGSEHLAEINCPLFGTSVYSVIKLTSSSHIYLCGKD